LSYLILIRLSQFSSLIPVIIGLLFYSKLNKPFNRLVWFLFFFVLIEFLSYWLSQLLGNNMPLSHIFTVIEFGMLISVFVVHFKIQTKYFLIIISIFTIIAFIDAFVLKNLKTFSSVAKPIESIIFTIAALYFYYDNFKHINQDADLFHQPMFWFSTSILIYFSINFFRFLLFNTVIKESINLGNIDYNIHSISNIIANFLYGMAFLSFKWKTS